jgi:hypothetical protein
MEELESDILNLKYSKQKIKEALLCLKDVESFKDEEYRQLGNLEESITDLLIQKELEIEKLKGE